jgi:hypothetical protein
LDTPLIGITGRARTGKDTSANYLVQAFGFKQVSFAAPLKAAAAIMLGITEDMVNGTGYDREEVNPDWGFSVREFLQKLGTEGCREAFREDFWINRARIEVESATVPVVISDVRFENEAEFIRKSGGVLLHIHRNTGLTHAHRSEQPLYFDEFDVNIDNTTTYMSLYNQLDNLMMRGYCLEPQGAHV